MKHIICAVRDSAADTFQRPFFVQTPAVAVRLFGDECKRAAEDNPMFAHPEHFELFEIGQYDDANATLTMVMSEDGKNPQPRSLARAVDFKPRAELRAVN